MFSGSSSFPITGLMKTLVVLSAIGASAMVGCAIAFVVWLFTHVHIG